jgi:hypothetical protein
LIPQIFNVKIIKTLQKNIFTIEKYLYKRLLIMQKWQKNTASVAK